MGIGVSVFERLFDRLGQHLPPEVEFTGQHPDVVKNHHSAVQDTELHHGMELFGDGTLHGVAVQLRLLEVKKCRIRNLARTLNDHISETDIDLQRDSRVAKV
jgi:hypothetical protein